MLQFKFADIGEGIQEGQIQKWLVKSGDIVKEGDTLCVIETDKVSAEIPSPVNGTISEIKAAAGTSVNVGDVLVHITEDGETPKIEDNEEEAGVVGELEVSHDVIPASTEQQVTKTATGHKILATPLARKIAADLNVDIRAVKGTGSEGRVMKGDIYAFSQVRKESVKEQPATGDTVRVKISRLRKTIAENMVKSKTIIPHVTSMDEFDVTELVKLRSEQKELTDVKLTYLPFIIKALTLALKKYPQFNAEFDGENDEIIYKKYYNVGIAVDTEEGLLVPVIRNADVLGILDIAKELSGLTEKARSRNLSLEELQNGTFTITNYGAAGLSYGVPIIRYPEAAILGIGLIKKTPVVYVGEIAVRDIMTVSLSYDHRIIDGGDAGRFITELKKYLTQPMLLLLS